MSRESKRVLIVATVVKTHIMQFHIPTLKLFKEMGWETAVAARNDYANPEDCQIPYCDQFYDISFERFPFKSQNVKCYKRLKDIIDQGNYQIIHCHTPVGGVLGRLAARKARKKGTRVLYTAHGFHFYRGAPLLNWLLYYPVEKICSHFADDIITINQEDYALAQRKMKLRNGGKVYYVPGVGIDCKKYSKATIDKGAKRRELGIPEDAVLLLSVGELNHNKNHETVIRAIADLNVYYVIAGMGDLRQYLESLIDALNLRDCVKLLGFRSDVKELCEAADIFVFPSFREGLSVSVMEAMASGLPCVASKIRGNTDLLQNGEGGFLCNPHHASEFAVKINLLAANAELREKMGKTNMMTIQKFDTETVIKEMQNIYAREILDN